MKSSAIFVALLALSLAACGSKKSEPDDKKQEAKKPATTAAKAVPGTSAPASAAIAAPAAAALVPVSDTYHGETVVDNYRWLEDWDDAKVQAWSKDQDRFTRATLAAMPHVKEIQTRVTKILSHSAVSYYGISQSGGHFFALKHQPPLKQSLLVRLSSLDDTSTEKVVLDPNVLDPSGSTTIDFYRPSAKGDTVAISLSKGGSESGDVSVYNVESGTAMSDQVPRVNGGTAGGDLVWQTDGTGFYYTRYPRGDERPAEDANFYTQVYFHKLGTKSADDRYEIGKEFPRIAEIELTTNKETGRLLATVQEGDGGKFAHYMRDAQSGKWTTLTKFGDGHVYIAFGPGTDLLVISTDDAPRGKLLQMPANGSVAKASLLIPEGKDTMVSSFWGSRSLVYANDRIFMSYQLGGPSEIRVFDTKGKAVSAPEQMPNSSAGSMVVLDSGNILFANGSWTVPNAWFSFDPASGKTEKTALVEEAPIDLSSVQIVRKFAISKDGTKIPVNIMIPKGAALDGTSPAVVTGYGGYGVSLAPRYRARTGLLLEQGFITAVVNLRGGGEYGESWHLEGNLVNKQNVFDDFAAALKLMVDESYTSTDRLIIQGGSNGGLLMGALMTQHPDMVKAVVSHVGIYDMLQVEKSPNGAFNITEFGTVENPDHFKALHAYSPYHHVKDGSTYPPVFFLTGANDPRVDPMQSRKFTARLQAATKKPEAVLLRTSFNTGHGGGTPLNERISQNTDVMAFILSELGRPFRNIP
ncbi:MAG: S9 family peptidase [Kofleriaceae bacterium]|nr:S9 family peptidase [Kofleriaceae bacterium]